MRPMDKVVALHLNIDGSKDDIRPDQDTARAPARPMEDLTVQQVFERPDTLRGSVAVPPPGVIVTDLEGVDRRNEPRDGESGDKGQVQ